MSDEVIEIADGDTLWRFDRSFLESSWTCIYGSGCQGILPSAAPELEQGCCSHGAHLGDGAEGRAEALDVAAYASVLSDDQWQFRSELTERGPAGIFRDAGRNHTRVVEGACVFLNRPGFPGGAGCALHIGAVAAGEAPLEWKPSVCWQLPIRVDWRDVGDDRERATVRRWSRADWGDIGTDMAWCCTERSDGGEAYVGTVPVVESLGDELTALVGHEVYVELRRRME